MSDDERTYGDAEVDALLAGDLARWESGGGAIRRRYRTAGWKGTLMVIATVGHLAEVAWHHPEISASYAWVDVSLTTHSAGGITAKDIALARRIEGVVAWRPGEEDGPLDGTPDDPRFAYVLPDED
jgi:4a-hydroxytetrahydrobiopterin dehydratase